MAKLLPPFILCPLSESKQFLGMSGDKLENKVILTLGKNIAIRYHVLEQKQEVSWISSRHWFTSHVVYCHDTEKYAAVIDYNTIILFDETDSNLSSIKKFKFNKQVSELKPTKTLGTLAVFKNGTIKSLACLTSLKKSGLASLKLEDQIDISQECILHTDINEKKSQATIIVGLNNEVQATSSSKPSFEKMKRLKILVQNLKNLNSDELSPTKFVVRIQHNEEFIIGFAILTSLESGNSVVYLCSDGFLYRKMLNPSSADSKIIADDKESSKQQSAKIGLVEKYVSCANPVVIKVIDSSSIIIYGCDASEEGAVIFVYDINYNILLTRQGLKLYSSPPIMERIGQHIFAPVGLHILVLNLRLTKARLSSVVGKHQIQGTDIFEKKDPWAQPWDAPEGSVVKQNLPNGHVSNYDKMEMDSESDEKEVKRSSSKSFQGTFKLVKTLEQDGQPESMICGQVIPQLIENQSIKGLEWVLNYFYDIPESCLVSILVYLVRDLIKQKENHNDLDTNEGMDLQEEKEMHPDSAVINQIILRTFDQKQLTRELRSTDFQTTKILLQYFWFRLNRLWSFYINENEEEYQTNNFELVQLMKWTSVIFDAQYPQFVFNNEIKLVDRLFTFINEKFILLNEVEGLEPLLTLILSKISYDPKPSPHTKFRTETITFE